MSILLRHRLVVSKGQKRRRFAQVMPKSTAMIELMRGPQCPAGGICHLLQRIQLTRDGRSLAATRGNMIGPRHYVGDWLFSCAYDVAQPHPLTSVEYDRATGLQRGKFVKPPFANDPPLMSILPDLYRTSTRKVGERVDLMNAYI